MLSDEDRRRIEEEERYRAQVRAGKVTPRSDEPYEDPVGWKPAGIFLVTLLAIFVIAAVMWGSGGSGNEYKPAKSEPEVTVTLSNDLICGKTQEDLRRIASGAQQGDMMGVFRMIERGDALQLKAGTNVLIQRSDGKMTRIFINTGVHSMSDCWAASANLK